VTENRPAIQFGNIGGVTGNVLGSMSGGTVTSNYGVATGTTSPAETVYDQQKPPDALYHLAFSFAGEQRDYVERTKEECEDIGLEVMYDLDRGADMWGDDFIMQQRQIYSAKTLFVVAFISADYLRKPVPRDEFKAAMWTDVQRGGGYILPLLMDDVDAPPELLHPSTAYIKVRQGRPTPQELAVLLNRKLLTTLLREPRAPKPIAEIVWDNAREQSKPKPPAEPKPPADPLDAIIEHLRARLVAGSAEFRALGCHQKLSTDNGLRFELVRAGAKVYELTVRRDRRIADTLVITVHRHLEFTVELRANAELVRDTYNSTPKVRLNRSGLLPGLTGTTVTWTKEELADSLWQDVTQRLSS
jgi:hypothetical protein